MLQHAVHDIRYAVRLLLKTPGSSLMTMLTPFGVQARDPVARNRTVRDKCGGAARHVGNKAAVLLCVAPTALCREKGDAGRSGERA